MNVDFEIPDPIAAELRSGGVDLAREAKVEFLLGLYRRRKITRAQLSEVLGLDGSQTDAILKRHAVTEQAPTRDEVDSDQLERAYVPSRFFTFGPESEEQLLEETILAWQSHGPAAVWQAMFDMLAWWFEARGLDPEAQRVDRARNEVHRVPWHGALAERGDDA